MQKRQLEGYPTYNHPEWRFKLINKPLKNEPYAFVQLANSALKAGIDKALSTMTALELSNLCEPYKIFVPSDMKLVEQCHL